MKIKAIDVKQGQLFYLSGDEDKILYRRVFENGYITTMRGYSGLTCIMGTNETSLTMVMVDNTVNTWPD